MTESAHQSRLPTGNRGERVGLDAAWEAARDQLLRGLVHALSNRVMALSTLAELAADGAAGGPEAQERQVLVGEARRLEQLLRQFRLITPAPVERLEPLHVAELAQHAVELLARHADAHDVAYDVSIDAGAPPGFGDASQVVRHLVVLLLAAGRVARGAAGPHTVDVRVGGDDRSAFVILRAGSARSTGADAARAATSEVRGVCVEVDERGDDGSRYVLVMPSLAEARRRGA